ncbi:MAG: exo-alpha-sialidase [Dehalococcoidia bacterium]|nr:MAG: exo-alpha-sialidase [Dehalococcoidia bacterium]
MWSQPVKISDTPQKVEGDEGLPKIAVGQDGRIYAVWSVPNEKGDKMRANTRFSSGTPDGVFAPAVTLNPVKNTARFPALEVSPDGTVFVGWIDRRVDSPAPRRIYLTRIKSDGSTIGSDANVGGPSCECCRMTMAFADAGKTIHIAYRQNMANVRDMVVQTSHDGGVTFAEPVRISDDGWYSKGCPHSGPIIATDARGNLHAVWWTPTSDPAQAGIYYTVSTDGGRTFAPRLLIDLEKGTGVIHPYLGIGERGDVYIVWSNFTGADASTQIFFRHLSTDGRTLGPVQQVSNAEGSASRPNLALSQDKLYVAWTETKENQSWVMLKTASLR